MIKYSSLSTFSIVAADPERSDVGVAVASKFIAVGSIVPWAKVKVGAVATQAWANVRFGPLLLEMLSKKIRPEIAVKRVLEGDLKRSYRQIGIVNASGEVFAYTGENCLEYAGHIIGNNYVVLGNILAGREVLENMAMAYESTRGELVDKLLAALKAGDNAGGDKRGKQSAAIIVLRPGGGYGGVKEGVGRYVDLRVDDHVDPVNELIRLFKIWELTILEREDPDDVYELSDIAEDLQKALRKLGYYSGRITGVLNEETLNALELWMSINNFENKMRKDGKIWGSIYRFLIEQAKYESE